MTVTDLVAGVDALVGCEDRVQPERLLDALEEKLGTG